MTYVQILVNNRLYILRNKPTIIIVPSSRKGPFTYYITQKLPFFDNF